MDTALQNISEQLKRIVRASDGLTFPVMSGRVATGSVDMTNGICSVILTAGDTSGETDNVAPVSTDGVLLNAVSLNSNGMILYPKDNSDVIVAEIDGSGVYAIVKCSDLVKVAITINHTTVEVTDGEVVFNGGELGGMVKVSDLVSRLNILEQDNNKIKQAFDTWVPVADDGGAALKTAAATWYAATLTETVNGDIENTAVKQ